MSKTSYKIAILGALLVAPGMLATVSADEVENTPKQEITTQTETISVKSQETPLASSVTNENTQGVELYPGQEKSNTGQNTASNEVAQNNQVGTVDNIELNTGNANNQATTFGNIEGKVDFHVNDGEAKAGDETTIQLPEQTRFKDAADQKISLKNEADVHFADATLSVAENAIKIAYNKNVEGLKNIVGGFNFHLRLRHEKFSEIKKAPLEFTVNRQTKIIKEIDFIGVGEYKPRPFEKSSWQGSKGDIETNINVGKNGVKINDVEIFDDIDTNSEDNATYDYDTFRVYAGEWKWDKITGWYQDKRQNITKHIIWLEKASGQFRIKIPSQYDGMGLSIVYRSKYLSPVEAGETINNKAVITGSNIQRIEWQSFARIFNINGWIKGDKIPHKPSTPPAPKVPEKPIIPAPDKPERPIVPAPEKPEEPAQAKEEASKVQAVAKTDNKRLPNTGDSTDTNIALFVLGAWAVLYAAKVWADDEDEE